MKVLGAPAQLEYIVASVLLMTISALLVTVPFPGSILLIVTLILVVLPYIP